MTEKIIIDGNTLKVEGFTTSDDDIVNFFKDISESERKEKLRQALKIGVTGLRSAQTADQIDYIEKKFSNLKRDFDNEIENVFGDNGKFQSVVEEHFGENGKLLKEVFDPSIEGTPLYQIKQKFDKEFEDLKKKIAVDEKEEELKEKMPQKGKEFEEALEKMLCGIAKHEGDKIKHTGDESGLLGESKKGDFVISLNNCNQKIVVEAKNRSHFSQPNIESEMEEAIENRGAEYGIFVARSVDQIPDYVGWMNEYNGNQLVIALTGEEDPELSEEILHIGYKWARQKVLNEESSDEEEIEINEIREEIKSVERSLKSFKTIKKHCTSVRKTVGNIETEIDDLRDNIETHLAEISNKLN